MKCVHKGQKAATLQMGTDEIHIHHCQVRQSPCVETQGHLDRMPGSTAVTCEGCPLFAAVMSDTEREFTGLPWGNGESVSGPGSSLDATATIRTGLPVLLNDLQVTSLLDIPCGDCHWMQSMFETAFDSIGYIGGDVVRELVERNRQRYPGRRFEHLDITSDTLPAADVVFVRDGLVHLPYSMIVEALKNIVGSVAKWLITTHFPGRTNHDIKLGHWRPLDLTEIPFKLPAPYRIMNEQCTEGDGAFTDKSLAVWKIDDIREAVSKMNAAPKLTIGNRIGEQRITEQQSA